MLFNEFGSRENLPVLLMHGMLQDWHSEYELLKPLEKHYRLIVPAMDGMYDKSGEFTCFSDQARQIEDYVNKNYGGRLHGILGTSQGGLMVVELLSRNKIEINAAITDGVYVAHQGKLAGYCTYLMFRSMKKNNGRPPKAMDFMIKLMGLKKDAYKMMDAIYWNVSDCSMKRNLIENYTYHASPDIRNSDTKVYLWCGSKEPYALKSHKILKKHLRNYEEEIFEGMGHCQAITSRQKEMCEKIREAFGE